MLPVYRIVERNSAGVAPKPIEAMGACRGSGAHQGEYLGGRADAGARRRSFRRIDWRGQRGAVDLTTFVGVEQIAGGKRERRGGGEMGREFPVNLLYTGMIGPG